MRGAGALDAPLAPARGGAGLGARRWLRGAAIVLLVGAAAGDRAHAQPRRPEAVLAAPRAAPRAATGHHVGAREVPEVDRPRATAVARPVLPERSQATRGRRIGRLFGFEVRLAPAVPWSDGRGQRVSAREPDTRPPR